MIEHLISVTAKHWDKSMRILASKALYTLVPLDPQYFIDTALAYLVRSLLVTWRFMYLLSVADTQCYEH